MRLQLSLPATAIAQHPQQLHVQQSMVAHPVSETDFRSAAYVARQNMLLREFEETSSRITGENNVISTRL